LQNRIKTHLGIDELIRERTLELERLKDSIISVLAEMVEFRDKKTGGHLERTSKYIRILVEAMETEGLYAEEMRTWNVEMMIASTLLHDVGKIVISDIILNKPGKLTAEEFEKIKSHTDEGEHIINKIIERTGDKTFLHHARLFAAFHHERWDGTGYPHGLKGTDIPLQGRIMAFADVFDALVSERSYKNPMSADEAIGIIMAGAGKQFDPRIAEVFFKARESFKAVV
jgi:putative two-component system response regulator